MVGTRRVFVVADFRDEKTQSIHLQHRMWVKGLLRLGLDVHRFSYRNMLMQHSPFGSKSMALLVAKKKCDRILMEQIRNYRPDIVFLMTMSYLDESTVRLAREAAPHAIFVGRDNDAFPEKNAARLAIAAQTHMVVATSAGGFLQTYKKAGVPLCAFIPNGCDPDIQYRYPAEPRWTADLLFTGKVEHPEHDGNPERTELLTRLARMPNARVHGSFGHPRIDGLDYFRAVSGAKIALSVNLVNEVRLYHSDRLINYVGCGTFTLARRVPDTELLFQDNKHLRYFTSPDEFFDLAAHYLRNERQREEIALAGMEHAHREFNCVRLAQILLQLIDDGVYNAPWAEIV